MLHFLYDHTFQRIHVLCASLSKDRQMGNHAVGATEVLWQLCVLWNALSHYSYSSIQYVLVMWILFHIYHVTWICCCLVSHCLVIIAPWCHIFAFYITFFFFFFIFDNGFCFSQCDTHWFQAVLICTCFCSMVRLAIADLSLLLL